MVNKIDRADARPEEVLDEVYDLFIDLDADEAQIDFLLYERPRRTTADLSVEDELHPLFDAIVEHIPGPEGDPEKPVKALVTNLDYNDYIGRLGVGRIRQGVLREGQRVTVVGVETSKTVAGSALYLRGWSGS